MATLHEEMKAVLSEAQEPLEPATIAERIAASGRLVRKDGKSVPVAQIVARAGKYPDLFETIEGKLGLKAPDPLVVGHEYTREQAHHRLERGTAFSVATWGKEDIVPIKSTEDCALFVTEEAPSGLAEGVLAWQSKPQQKLSHPTIAGFLGHDPDQSTVHLFLRTDAEHDYTYLGPVAYLDHEPDQEKPVKLRWKLLEPLTPEMSEHLGVSAADGYQAPPLEVLHARLAEDGHYLQSDLLRRYHLALRSGAPVLLAGASGSGKTSLAVSYARAASAKYLLVPVHHSWNSLEDLLGRPEVVLWLREAGMAERRADKDGVAAVPYYLILDDCNLAAMEDYLAEYLAGQCEAMTMSNLYLVGTVHHDGWGLTDWILDRAQLIEIEPVAKDLLAHLGDAPYRGLLLQCWQALKPTAPFAFRTLDQIKAYLAVAEQEGLGWEQALDEQMVQKLLPRVKADTSAGGDSLGKFLDLIGDRFPRARAYAERLLVEAGDLNEATALRR